jgi:all-trans-retinol dehydrogenase (NAD+)
MLMNRFTCRAFGPDMVKRNKGHIVEIASMSSFLGVGVFSDYSACKLALVSFTESESCLLYLFTCNNYLSGAYR